MMGATPETAVQTALDAGADIIGANCGTSLNLEAYAQLTQQLLTAAKNAPVIVQPNAGNPTQDGDKITYATTPGDFAQAAKNYIALGAKIVGGCCGTTPRHIAASSAAIKKQL
jgi:5-methyltetrahydrofolate--homocysteine methyltransferase